MERTFDAPAQAVFDAWTNEEVIRRWFHAGHDWETTVAEVDLRVGGEVRVVMRDPHEDAEYGGGGRYTEIDPPRRLAFTWYWDDNDTRQLIELDFDANLLAFDALEHAAKALAARDQLLHFDLGFVAGPRIEVGRPHQRPVDAGRGHLERVLTLHGIAHVEDGG